MALRFRRGLLAGLGVSLLALAVDVARGQEPIRVKVNLVSVAFVARDASGALVNNLTQDDVEVLEDAIPQKIAFFSRSADVPLTLGLVVDASGSQDHFSKQHKNDLEVFFKDVLGPKDRVFLVGFGNHIRLVSDFSQSGGDLLNSGSNTRSRLGDFQSWGRARTAIWGRHSMIRFIIR
jgi:VWFA-related protein